MNRVDGLQDAGHPLEALLLRAVWPLLGHHAYPLVPQHPDREHGDAAPVVDEECMVYIPIINLSCFYEYESHLNNLLSREIFDEQALK